MRAVHLLCLAILLSFTGVAASAQEAPSLSGVVKDPAGLLVPNASVLIAGDSAAAAQKTTTDLNGAFSFPALASGSYTVEIDAQGFALLQKPVNLVAGQPIRLDLTLVLASASQSISVSGEADPYGVVPTRATEAVFGIPETLAEVPRTVTNVDSSLLNLYSARTVNDLVTVIPGSFTAAYFGVPGSVFLRGDIADNYFRGFRRVENRGNYQTPLSASDHIEIVEGPPSPIYGPGRIGGFMNFYPKTARSGSAKWMDKGHGALTARYGQYDDKVGSIEYGMPFKIAGHSAGVYGFFEAKDSRSFYKGVFDRYKLGQIAFDMDATSKLHLAFGFQGFHDHGIQALGWNRVTQDLVDNGNYLAGTPAINLSSNNFNIGPNDMPAGLLDTFAFQQNMGAAFPYFPNAKYYALNPATVHTVKLPLDQIMVDTKADFLSATTYTAYADVAYDIKPGLTFKNQSFYDRLDSQKYSSYGFGASYKPWTIENKSTLTFSWKPNETITMNNFAGYDWSRVQTVAGEERDQYQVVDRRDLSVGPTPNDRFQGPFTGTPNIPFQYYDTGFYRDSGAFWLSDISFWNRLVLTGGARYDRYSPDFYGRFAGEPLTHATGTHNAGLVNASISYRTPLHINPYFTFANSRFLDLGQGNELDATEIPTGAYIQPSSLYEAGAKADFGQAFYGSLAFFRQRRSSFNTESLALDYLQSKGVELETRAFLFKRVSLTGALTWQNPQHLNAPFLLAIPPSAIGLTPQQAYGGKFIGLASGLGANGPFPVAGQPHWVVSPFATVNITKNIGVLLGTTWTSSVVAGYVDNVKLPSYSVWRGSVFYRRKSYEANIGANNMFDAKYFQSQYLFEDALIKPGELHTVSGSIRYNF